MKWKIAFSFILVLWTLHSEAQCQLRIHAPQSICLGDTVSLTAFGGCGVALLTDFNDSTLGSLQSNSQQLTGIPCRPAPDNSPYLWMGTIAGQALVYTGILNLSSGGYSVCFDMVYGEDGSPGLCDGPATAAEAVHLQYSVNNGASWTDIQSWNPNGGHDTVMTHWKNYCINLPTAAQTNNVRLRWTQLTTLPAQTACWGLDNVIIKKNISTFYQWSDGHNGANHPSVSPLNTTTYYVTATSAAGSITDSLTLQVFPRPTADFVISTPRCKNQWINFTYTGNGDSTDHYHWNFENPALVTDSNKMNAKALWNKSDLYTITLKVNDGRCSSFPVSKNILVAPLISFYISNSQGCAPLEVSFTGNVNPPDATYLWDFKDGTTDTAANPVHLYTQAGDYGLSLTAVTDSGCTDTLHLPLITRVFPDPDPDFSFSPDIVPWSNPAAAFTNLTPNGKSYFWNFNDPGSGSNTSTQENPKHIFSKKGLFNVMLKVTTDKGCSDSIYKTVRVADDQFKMPNVITPNGDGINDRLIITNRESLKYCQIEIFNRWGKLIYQNNNYQNDWDAAGYSDGIYYYHLRYESWFEKNEINGFFHVMR